MPLSLERLLIYAPMLAIATAASPWAAAVSLGAFFLLSVEARRAALECVRWLDDKEDFARDTSVWRALLVLAAFMAVQTFSAQILAWGAFTPITTASIAYCASAAVLVALTARERGGLGSIPISPRRMWSYAAGVGLGLASGAFVMGYFFLLRRFGVAAPNSIARSSGLAAAMFVVFAPIAEEIFFRGWLQQAVGHEYARRGAVFQVVATAFAFAAIHPTLSYAPAFVFGLGAGALARASGGIGPGIVAHAMTNAVALYVA
jgi:membrane protease YdiL (CAAX protease family)